MPPIAFQVWKLTLRVPGWFTELVKKVWNSDKTVVEFYNSSMELTHFSVKPSVQVIRTDTKYDASVKIESISDTAIEGKDFYIANKHVKFPVNDGIEEVYISIPRQRDLAGQTRHFKVRLSDPSFCVIGSKDVVSLSVSYPEVVLGSVSIDERDTSLTIPRGSGKSCRLVRGGGGTVPVLVDIATSTSLIMISKSVSYINDNQILIQGNHESPTITVDAYCPPGIYELWLVKARDYHTSEQIVIDEPSVIQITVVNNS